MLNPLQLQTLQAVLRTGSFADAARELGYTGSAVSQQIAALERATRTQLFERHAHGISPTPIAQFLAERANQVLGQLRTLEDDIVLQQNGTIGRVRLGSFPSAAERLLPDAISRFQYTHPGVVVHLDEGEPDELFRMLEAHELDVALVYRYGAVPIRVPRGFEAEFVFREALYLLLPSGHPRCDDDEPLRVDRLQDDSWITARAGTAGGSTLRRLCAETGFEPMIVHRSNNYSVIHGLVAAGLGIAVVPELSLRPTEGVVSRRVDGEKAYRDVMALRSPTLPDASWETLRHALLAATDRSSAFRTARGEWTTA
ncbi:LysR family transcriptional regulator [Kribbella yunnanensis]|uniref:LysR family transcriptional regulator n=1 Tax=Kribbella yunnanensis TaxID=190194 RepID=A0ABP4UYY9_9ACTN